jgi:NADH:ubiquinone oxidoreductase subunit 4 (subunit M)
MIILAHGLTSSGMFRGANIMYERSHSRRITLNKGVLSALPVFSLLWFLLIIINFAGPFTLNLFREIMMINSILAISVVIATPVFFFCFFSAAYNLMLYASSQQGLAVSGFTQFQHSLIREVLVLFAHIWPVLLILGFLIILRCNILKYVDFVSLTNYLVFSNNKI